MTSSRQITFLHSIDQMLRDCATPIDWRGQNENCSAHAPWALIAAITDGDTPATTACFSGPSLSTVWSEAKKWLAQQPTLEEKRIRIDWVTTAQSIRLSGLRLILEKVKRNYARIGIASDPSFTCTFHEQELNARGIFCADLQSPQKTALHLGRLRQAMRTKFNRALLADQVVVFRSSGLYASMNDPITGQELVCQLHTRGVAVGRRLFGHQSVQNVDWVLLALSRYLIGQVSESGRFRYGVFPRFSRDIGQYNMVRHGLAVIALMQLYWALPDQRQLHAACRAWDYLRDRHIQPHQASDPSARFVIEENGEIKLGACGIALAAACLMHQNQPNEDNLRCIRGLVRGIAQFRDPDSGRFHHVLDSQTLKVKAHFRILYYEGEAMLGLLNAHEADPLSQALGLAEQLFVSLQERQAWTDHDHWLAQALPLLARYRPELGQRALDFAVKNTHSQLSFIASRKTAFPTLLEQALAFRSHLKEEQQKMAGRGNGAFLPTSTDRAELDQAIDARADLVLNGFFWPEVAMFFPKPKMLEGGFFIRHHDFRVRIDDVAHAILGLLQYRAMKNEAG